MGIANTSRTVRLPVHIAAQARKIRDRERELAAQLGREVTPVELADALGMEFEEVRDILAADGQPTSLDRGVGEGEDTSLGDLIADDSATPDEEVAEDESRRAVLRVVSELPSPERDVLKLRFGLGGEAETALRETGRRLGMSAENVRQIEDRALRKLAADRDLAALRAAA